MENMELTEQAEDRIALAGGQRLVIKRRDRADVITLFAADGRVNLSIHVTDEGPMLQISGAELTIEASGRMSLEAEHVDIHGRSGLSLTSGGDIEVETPGDLHSKARIQNLTADLGNVNVKANDDVRINGERVLVNC